MRVFEPESSGFQASEQGFYLPSLRVFEQDLPAPLRGDDNDIIAVRFAADRHKHRLLPQPAASPIFRPSTDFHCLLHLRGMNASPAFVRHQRICFDSQSKTDLVLN